MAKQEFTHFIHFIFGRQHKATKAFKKLLKIRFIKDLLKVSVLRPSPILWNKIMNDYEKQMVPGTSYHPAFGLQNVFRKIPFLVIYYLDENEKTF